MPFSKAAAAGIFVAGVGVGFLLSKALVSSDERPPSPKSGKKGAGSQAGAAKKETYASVTAGGSSAATSAPAAASSASAPSAVAAAASTPARSSIASVASDDAPEYWLFDGEDYSEDRTAEILEANDFDLFVVDASSATDLVSLVAYQLPFVPVEKGCSRRELLEARLTNAFKMDFLVVIRGLDLGASETMPALEEFLTIFSDLWNSLEARGEALMRCAVVLHEKSSRKFPASIGSLSVMTLTEMNDD